MSGLLARTHTATLCKQMCSQGIGFSCPCEHTCCSYVFLLKGSSPNVSVTGHKEVSAATGATAPTASLATDLTVVGGGGGGGGGGSGGGGTSPTSVTQTVTPGNPAANAPVTVNGTITSPAGTTPTGTITVTVSPPIRLCVVLQTTLSQRNRQMPGSLSLDLHYLASCLSRMPCSRLHQHNPALHGAIFGARQDSKY